MSCTLFWKDLLNATFIYSWSFTPENDYQAVSLSLFKHFITTYTPLCWLHPSCTTMCVCVYIFIYIYVFLPHIYMHTRRHTHRHTRTTAHAGNICNLRLFVCSPHSCWIISLKNKTKCYSCQTSESTKKRQVVGTLGGNEKCYVQSRSYRLCLCNEQDSLATLLGTCHELPAHRPGHSLWDKGTRWTFPVG